MPGQLRQVLATVEDALVVGCASAHGDDVVGFQLTDGGSWSGVVTFEGRVVAPGETAPAWTAVEAFNLAARGTVGTTRNAVGLYGVRTGGLSEVRARLSTASAGSLIVTARPSGT